VWRKSRRRWWVTHGHALTGVPRLGSGSQRVPLVGQNTLDGAVVAFTADKRGFALPPFLSKPAPPVAAHAADMVRQYQQVCPMEKQIIEGVAENQPNDLAAEPAPKLSMVEYSELGIPFTGLESDVLP